MCYRHMRSGLMVMFPARPPLSPSNPCMLTCPTQERGALGRLSHCRSLMKGSYITKKKNESCLFRRIEQLHFEIRDNPRIIIVFPPVHLFIVFPFFFVSAFVCCCLFFSVAVHSTLFLYIRQHLHCFCFPHFADDNKPIWMHAEEREESKVSYYGRPYYGSGLDGGV